MKKTILLLAALLIVSGCRSAAPAAKGVMLFSKGKCDYAIILPDRSPNPGTDNFLKEAALRFQQEFRKSSGVTLPVVKESAFKGDKAVSIGRTRLAECSGIDFSKMRFFQGVIAVRNGNLFLAGNDCHAYGSAKRDSRFRYYLGSVKAATVFMERYLGTVFALPGAVGTHTPAKESLELPGNLTIPVKPALVYSAGRIYDLMYAYSVNYLGDGAFHTYGGHSFYPAVPRKKYASTHPEYFAMIGGKRDVNGDHLCISNPEVRDLIYQEALRRLDAGALITEVGQTDGYRPCRCAKCQALPGTEGEKLWDLFLEMAKKLKKERPGKMLQLLSYSVTAEPPTRFSEFPGNVMIELCDSTPESFRKWQHFKGIAGYTVYIYNWGEYHRPGFTAIRPPEFCTEQAKRFLASRVTGIYHCGFGEAWGLEGPAYYIYGKAFEEPGTDAAVLLERYLKGAFPTALIPMKSFFATLHSQLKLTAPILDNIKDPRQFFSFTYPPSVLNTLENALARAEKMKLPPDEKKRVALVRRDFDYLKDIVLVIHAYNAYSCQPTKELFDRISALIDHRNGIIDSWYDANGRMKRIPGWPEIPYFGNPRKAMVKTNGRLRGTLGAPFTWDFALLRQKGVIPNGQYKKTTVCKAQGKVDFPDFESGAWKNARWQECGGIQLAKVAERTRFKLLYDKENFYIAVESELKERFKYAPRGFDGDVWMGDSIELMLDPAGSRENYYHIMCNPVENSRYDAAIGFITDPLDPRYGKDDASWNGKWSYQTHRANGVWRILFTIPYKELKTPVPQAGSVWCGNIGRESFTSGGDQPELALWSPNLETFSFHDKNTFGEFIFE